MKKSTAVVWLMVLIAATIGLGYMLWYGVGENQAGAIKNTKLGLDLAGGVSITYEVVGDEVPSQADIDDTVEKLRKRIDKYSTESQVYPEGDNRISIEIPGITDAEAVLADLGSPGALYFIRSTGADGLLNYQYQTSVTGSMVYSEGDVLFVFDEMNNAYLYDTETDSVALDENQLPIPYTVTDTAMVRSRYELTRSLEELQADGSLILSGTDVQESEGIAYADEYGRTQFIVTLKFTEAAAEIFANATQEASVKSGLAGTIAIYYDGELISVPNVDSRIDGGEAQISGMRSMAEAQRVAQDIRIGGLKLELKELRSNVVGAQLGTEAISTSIKAGIIGLALVMLFMIFVYYIPGFASSVALGIYVLLTMLSINFLEITLTLPGIAGIILSIGMAVDANVIIFARIREEIAIGMTVSSAIKSGFSKALSAIVDGNITTLIAAVVLIAMGSGTVKGFGYTLALGIVLSMFTALFITKLIINILYALGFQDEKWYGAAKKPRDIKFLQNKKLFFSISLVIILIGVGAMVFNSSKIGDPLNYSMEFKGGTATNVTFETALNRETIDSEIVPEIEKITGDANIQWTTVNDSNEVIFKTRTLSNEERAAFKELMESQFGVNPEMITVETIGSTISGEMQKDSIMAVLVATVCMLIYIWFRFSDFRFGTSAVLALVHDVFVVITFYALIRLSVGSTFIACMLTIVGYSINATIVIFDRIRENMKEMKKKETLEDVVNKSISQTLSRSLFTSVTTFLMVVVLYIMGVSSIREFAMPLMIGIISGTFSSICLTGAMWYFLREKFPQAEEED